MNYGKLQLSFILLFIMSTILSLTCFFLIKHFILTATSVISMILCIIGLLYAIKDENNQTKN